MCTKVRKYSILTRIESSSKPRFSFLKNPALVLIFDVANVCKVLDYHVQTVECLTIHKSLPNSFNKPIHKSINMSSNE